MIPETDKARLADLIQEETKIDQQTASLALRGYIPFSTDLQKQKRYIEFLERAAGLRQSDSKTKTKTLDVVIEEREFSKAAKIYKPMSSVMATRFTSSSTPALEEQPIVPKIGLFIPDPNVYFLFFLLI